MVNYLFIFIHYLDLNYSDNEEKYRCCKLGHPSYVYSIEFFPDFATISKERLIMATACFDSKVRIWIVYFDRDHPEKATGCSKQYVILV